MANSTETKVKFTVGAESDIEDETRIENLTNARAASEMARELAKKEAQRAKNIKTWIGLALLVIPMIVILLNTFVKKEDTDTSKKIEAVSGALYKIMQVIANNPNALAISSVAAQEGADDDISNFQFPQFQRRNLTGA
jgi:predicted nucleic acid-binding Zn ribbon protein